MDSIKRYLTAEALNAYAAGRYSAVEKMNRRLYVATSSPAGWILGLSGSNPLPPRDHPELHSHFARKVLQ